MQPGGKTVSEPKLNGPMASGQVEKAELHPGNGVGSFEHELLHALQAMRVGDFSEFRNRILQNAEFWPGEFSDIPASAVPVVAPAEAGGMGFDVVQHDYLRRVLRDAVGAASAGANAGVSMSAIAAALYPPGFDHAWRAVTCIENHDLVLAGRAGAGPEDGGIRKPAAATSTPPRGTPPNWPSSTCHK